MTERNDPRFTRAILLQVLVEPFRLRGGDIYDVLHQNRIPTEALSDPNRLIEATALYGAMEDMAASLGDPQFCANIARALALQGVPMLRDSATRAKNLGCFLISVVLEVGRQFDNVAYTLNVSHDAAVFSIRRTRSVKRPTSQVDAIGIAFYVTLIQSGLGERFDSNRIVVSAPTIEGVPADFLPSQALVRSSRTALSITFPPDWLLAPFDLGWSIQEQRYFQPNLKRQTELTLFFIREILRDNIANKRFDLTTLARTCATNRRRLQRIFAAHGTTFRAVQDNLRHEIAVNLVTCTKTPLKDVAQQTGFSSEATFTRSYKRWTGESPGKHRRQVASRP